MNLKFIDFLTSKTFKGIVVIVGALVVALLIFQAGMMVGFKKASFSYKFGDNYSRMFGDRNSRDMRSGRDNGMSGQQSNMQFDNFVGGHGAVGKVVSINLPTIVVFDQNNLEKPVVLTDQTIVRELRDTVSAQELQIGDEVTVLGTPNEQGQIEARFVRIVSKPSPASESTSTTSQESTATSSVIQ